jgi:hypothetical protein
MNKIFTLVLTLAGMAVLTSSVAAQGSREAAQGRGPTLPCCKCLGDQTTLNLSTGQGSPTDPLWKVNNGSAYTVTSMPPGFPWIALPGAKWIQPVAGSTPQNTVPPGVYKYRVDFYIAPECAIRSEIKLEGKFSADNGATATLDPGSHPVGSCPGIYCFKTSAALAVNPSWLTPGQHTLEIDVTNQGGYAGLIVDAKLTRQCVKGP